MNRRLVYCGRFALNGLPYSHAFVTIHHASKNFVDYVSCWYSKNAHKRAYRQQKKRRCKDDNEVKRK